MKKIIYVTNNLAKIASAKQALAPLGYEIDNIKIDTPEIQANDVTDVSKYSANCEPGKDPIVFEGITKGRIDVKKSGTYGWSWDFIFIPEGEEKTLACFPDEERWNFWSLDAYRKLACYLEKKKGLK